MTDTTTETLSINDVLTAPEAATEKGVPRGAVLKAIRKGHLTARKSGNTWLIDRRSLEQWRPAENGQESRPEPPTATTSLPIPAELSPEEEKRRSEELIRMLHEWLEDESGYDEETWPKLQAALDEDRPSYRKLFPTPP